MHLLMLFDNRSLRNVLTLFAAVKIQNCTPQFVLNKIRTFWTNVRQADVGGRCGGRHHH